MNTVTKVIIGVIAVPVVAIALWIVFTLNYTYSSGERAGYIQKISSKGWICKTWEVELAMANLPGAMPQIFTFSVRDDAVAHEIEKLAGQRASLHYEEHPGIPTSCFGDTPYFIVEVRAVTDGAAPATPPPAPPAPAPQ